MTDWSKVTLGWLTDFARQGILATDTELIIRTWNRWLEVHSGHAATDVLGRNLLEVYPDLVERGLDRYYQEAAKGKAWALSSHFHGYLLPLAPTYGGPETMQQSAQIAPLQENGRVIGTITSIHDVTARVQREVALRESAEWLRTTLRSIGDAVIATDNKGLVTLMNPVAEELTGWTENEALTRHLEDVFNIINEQTGEPAENPVARVLREGIVVGLANHTTLIARDQTRRSIADSGAPLRGPHGVIVGTVMVFRDITDRVREQDELERLYQQAHRDAETKAILLREVNHRVRNNLVAITGLLKIEQSYTSEDQATYAATVESLTTRIAGLAKVHGLLLAAGWSAVRLSDLVGQIIKSAMQIRPRHKQVFIDVSPASVRVSPGQANSLALVVSELATNTLKHALVQREAVRISTHITLEGDTVVFELRDDGPGYPEDVLQLQRHRVGFDLIQSLVSHDLQGELSLHNDGGAVTTIRFTRDRADTGISE